MTALWDALWNAASLVGGIASRLVNALFFRGSVYQTLSARAHIEARHDPAWERLEQGIDRVAAAFGARRHCAESWDEEVARARRTIRREEASRDPDFMLF